MNQIRSAEFKELIKKLKGVPTELGRTDLCFQAGQNIMLSGRTELGLQTRQNIMLSGSTEIKKN